MSKKRIILVAILIALITAVAAFFISSTFKKSPEVTENETENVEESTLTDDEDTQEALEPLPVDNKAAIESEINNIEKELNSAIETDLNDLSDIENSF